MTKSLTNQLTLTNRCAYNISARTEQNLITDCSWTVYCVLPTAGATKSYRLYFQFLRREELFPFFLDINGALKET
jgi:hypothetical protein